MKKKALALAVASALIAPSAFAASDTSGMQYTSASEGFYGSLRARYLTAQTEGNGADIQSGSSRIGIGGTADLGGGLTGFYGWELGVALDDASGNKGLDQRLGNVGLRGDFGQVVFGSFWTFDYSATHGSTDQANTHSGYFNYTADREARSERSFQYTTPDFNGFQSALLFSFKNGKDEAVTGAPAVCNTVGTDVVVNCLVANSAQDTDAARLLQRVTVPAVTAVTAGKDENDLDSWNLAGQYAVQGFTLGGSYNVRPDALTKRTLGTVAIVPTTINNGTQQYLFGPTSQTDAKSWTIRGSYAQDNWNVNAWYGQDNTSDSSFNNDIGVGRTTVQNGTSEAVPSTAPTKAEDTTFLAFHAGVAVDKVNLYAIHEIKENADKAEDTYTTLGVQYSLGAQARTWLEYTAQDYDTDSALEDYINIGLRFDF